MKKAKKKDSKGPVACCAPGPSSRGALDPALDQGSPLRSDALDPADTMCPQQAAGYLMNKSKVAAYG
jgi:hypothetical protein